MNVFLWIYVLVINGAYARDICTPSAVLEELGSVRRGVTKSIPINADLSAHMEIADTLGMYYNYSTFLMISISRSIFLQMIRLMKCRKSKRLTWMKKSTPRRLSTTTWFSKLLPQHYQQPESPVPIWDRALTCFLLALVKLIG